MRVVRPVIATALALAACAKGTENSGDDVDATVRVDAANTDAPAPDAQVPDAQDIDAPAIDAAIDAALPIDAGIDAGCTTMVLQRLVNPAFDQTPMGTGWVQTPHNAAYPIVTDQDGIAEHTAPYKAWLAGWDETAIDEMYQDVAIPAGTTMLTLRGQYSVATSETGSMAYDTCNVELRTTGGALLQSVMALSNLTVTTTWTPFQLTFASPHAGQTVRLHFRSSSDFIIPTAFFFDSLALEATVCQ